MQRIDKGIVSNTVNVSKVRIVYANKQWNVQYKTSKDWVWKSYLVAPNYVLAKGILDDLYMSGEVTTHKYVMNETMEIMELTESQVSDE